MFSKIFLCFSKTASINCDAKIYEQTCVDDVLKRYPKKIIQYEDTQPFVPPITTGQVVKVYDGDAFAIACYLPYNESPLYRFSVQLNGIEMPRAKGGAGEEARCADIMEAELSNMIMDKTVVLANVRTEKYGRLLADVYVGGVHVNQHMLDMKLSLMYNDGVKINMYTEVKGGFGGI
jgi:endonuclease YncB( thermonuclease family)